MDNGLTLKAEAVGAGIWLYRLAAEVQINPVRLSRLLNNHERLDEATAVRIRAAIDRLTPTEVAVVA